jgi:hypothetical protein
MAEPQPTVGATEAPSAPAEGTPFPSREAVATGGQQQQPLPAPDSQPSSRDLSQDEDFRKYDSKMQRTVAALKRENEELKARQQAQHLASTEATLREQGLDEKTIEQAVAPYKEALFVTNRDLVLAKLGMTMADVDERVDYGKTPAEFEANMRRKLELRTTEQQLKAREQALAQKEREAAEQGRLAERDERRQSGADRQPRSDTEPSPDDMTQWRQEVAAAKRTGGDVAAVNRKWRNKGLKI